MEVIEISGYIPQQQEQQRRQLTPSEKRRARTARIVAAAVKAGLFIGAAALVGKAVVWAAEVTQGRLSIPGGEIFTIPFIVALVAAGYVLRGDVEARRRRKRREQRRQHNEQRGK